MREDPDEGDGGSIPPGPSYHENIVIAGGVLGETNSVFHHIAFTNATLGGNNNSILGVKTQNWLSLRLTNNYVWLSNSVVSGLAAGQELVKSYIYFDQRPQFWGGTQPWPWVDPTNTVKSLASYTYTNFPAGYRSLFITNPPTSDTIPPTLVNVRDGTLNTTSRTVDWGMTETCTNHWVTYSLNSNLSSPSSTTNAATGTSVTVTLTGLSPGTQYYYAAYSVDTSANMGQSVTNTFTTESPAVVIFTGRVIARIR
jgi:hypothetical protein